MNYETFVTSLLKPGHDIQVSLTPEKCELLHAILLLSGEAGELLDAVKKHIIYDKPLDVENVIEELGDIEFSLVAIYDALRKIWC